MMSGLMVVEDVIMSSRRAGTTRALVPSSRAPAMLVVDDMRSELEGAPTSEVMESVGGEEDVRCKMRDARQKKVWLVIRGTVWVWL